MARELLSARADGEVAGLGEGQLAGVEAHVAGCVGCASFLVTVDLVRRELRMASVTNSIDVTASVLADVAEMPDALEPREAAPAASPIASPTRSGRLVGVAAAIVAVVAIGAFLAGRSGRTVVEVTTADGPQVSALVSDLADPSARGQLATVDPFGTAGLFAVWSPDGLDPGLAMGLAAEPEVGPVVEVRRATLGLTGSHDGNGVVIDQLDGGWFIPVDVVSVDVAAYGELLDVGAVRYLESDEVVLSSTSARLRRLEAGAVVAFGDTSLQVAAVIEDHLMGSAEMLVGAQAGAELGIEKTRYVVFASSADPVELQELLALHTEQVFRVLDGGVEVLRNSDAVASQAELKMELGEFSSRAIDGEIEVDPVWFGSNIVSTELPSIGPVTCHRAVLAALEAVLQKLVDGQLVDPDWGRDFQGCWNPRTVRTTADLSHHSWGAAVDVLGADAVQLDPAVVQVFEDHGFSWGGRWLRADVGHFEFDVDR